MTEYDLIKGTLYYLNSKGFEVWRQENVGLFNQKKATNALLSLCTSNVVGIKLASRIKNILSSSYYHSPFTRKGVPDIIGFNKKTGVFIGVEIKTKNDFARQEQKHFLRTLTNAGGYAFICRDVETFINEFENFLKSKE